MEALLVIFTGTRVWLTKFKRINFATQKLCSFRTTVKREQPNSSDSSDHNVQITLLIRNCFRESLRLMSNKK